MSEKQDNASGAEPLEQPGDGNRKVDALVGLCASCDNNDDLVSSPDDRDGGACLLGHGTCDRIVKYCPDYIMANTRAELPGR